MSAFANFESSLSDCQVCGRFYRAHGGSTPCCGSVAGIIYDGEKILESSYAALAQMGWDRIDTPVGTCWYNSNHPACQDGNVIHADEDLVELLMPSELAV